MILVTGATGLVGGNLLWHLLQQNDRVTAIRRHTSNLEPLRVIFSFYTSTPDPFLARIDWRIADVLLEDSIQQAMQGISVVYHCAAVVSLGRETSILMDTNVVGTRNVVRAALDHAVGKFCFVSSIAACGRAVGNEPVDESTPWDDIIHRSLYSRSKFYSEQEVWKGYCEGLNVVIVCPAVILGVSGTPGGSSQLFSQVRKGLMFYSLGGSGYVDVQDVVKAMILLMHSQVSGERFILSAGNYSNKDILSWIADGFSKKRPFIQIGKPMLWCVGFLSEVLGRVFSFHPLIDRSTALTATSREYYSNRKIERELGFQFSSMEKSIQAICHFLSKTDA